MDKPPPSLGVIVRFGRTKWRIGAILLTGSERYYVLTNTSDENDVALMPWFVVES